MDYALSVVTSISISMIGVLAVFIITGLSGMFSVGTASFMLIGAYTAGMLATSCGMPMPVGIIAGMGVGMLLAYAIGFPTVKLRMDYVALVTFGFGEAIVAFINNMTSVTGGALGLSGINKETTPVIALIALVAVIFVVYSYSKSKYGRQSIAIKNNPLAAAAMGINVNSIKLLSFVLAGGIAAFAGVLYVYHTTFVEPSGFGWLKSADWIIIVFVGGINSLTGAVLSGLLLCGLPEVLRSMGEWRIVIYCVIVLVIVNFRPQGLFGKFEFSIAGIRNWFRRKFGKKAAGALPGGGGDR